MRRLIPFLFAVLCLAQATEAPRDRASRKPTATRRPEPSLSTEQLAARARNSVVRIQARGREGRSDGVGTGFVITTNGLIATSLHVIGEGRPFEVRFNDGTTAAVTGIHAWDRASDLAILRTDRLTLTPLPLGDSDTAPQGTPTIALGNPLGLDYSVVEGVLSGRHDMQGIPMLQLAIPIEPGNSGGPVLDRSGRVLGVLNAKSLLTRNLGFATPINRLKSLLSKPNSMPINGWLRLGALDETLWKVHLGANWRQKGNRLIVDGAGSGFGGRSYLAHLQSPPSSLSSGSLDLRVTVKLGDESGAAGLFFQGNADGRHYGFYPTAGNLRFTAFEGPDLNSWRILTTLPSPSWRPGEWNRLRVRIDSDRIRCFVNGAQIFETTDQALRGSQVGLTKFRGTTAEFRDFSLRLGVNGPDEELPPDVVAAFSAGREPVEALRTNLPAADAFIAERARRLEAEATRLRALVRRLHREAARDLLLAELSRPEAEINLTRSALLLALHDQPGIDIEAYERHVVRLGTELKTELKTLTDPSRAVEVLRRFLFEDHGFHGSRGEYRSSANSHLNEVLDDREGIPITLSIVFLEVGRAAGIPHLDGFPLPGHFLVKYAPPGIEPRLYDPYNGGVQITFSDASELGSASAGVPVRSEFIQPALKREIITRMINNLRAFSQESGGDEGSLPYADLLVALAHESRAEVAARIDRARLRARMGNRTGAAEDLRHLIDLKPAGLDLQQIEAALKAISEEP